MEELDYHNHMCLGRNIKCRDRMLQNGLADDKTIFILNHFSHNGKSATYDEFSPIAKKKISLYHTMKWTLKFKYTNKKTVIYIDFTL